MRGEVVREYLRGALWVLPTAAVVLALAVGYVLAQVQVSSVRWYVFQGTPDDARTLLIAISSTLATVIALVLGLTVVALQLASTQFSPRLLRNFLRDRPNQVVLSVFVATFTYSTAGLFTVGVSAGRRVDDYPRLAVSFALALLFISLLMLVFFVHHLAHSIQIDEVMRSVERRTLHVIEHDLPTRGVTGRREPPPPASAIAVPAHRSGYVQTVHPEVLVPQLAGRDLVASVAAMVGEYVVAGAPLLWLWRPGAGDSPAVAAAVPAPLRAALPAAVRVGFERTVEQDVAFGVRQLADIAVKALSPAINDPYTTIQSLEHLGVLLASLVRRPLGDQCVYDAGGSLRVVVPGRDLAYYLDLATGQIRRYGCAEPRVDRALIRVLATTGRFCTDPDDRRLVAHHVELVVDDARRAVAQAADLAPVREHGARVLEELAR
ncbi:DUF2254 domain-containing protein [Nocardioides sp. GY 10113]|uniref:DUF2254 domain-containing protein n=1 Tax=Nocardioides sp. GY 10113 TaxID=2569761 RepID=UPI0014586C1E|nr:DUF2254 domain-containing protein [Nocardioides sp. GY 10113]